MEITRRRAAPMSPDERRAAIIDAVVPLLERHGAEVSTRQIAEAAGIAEGTIFRVFPDKRALFLAVAERTVTPPRWREDMAAVLAGEPTLEAKMLAVVERMVERTRRVMLVMTALRGILMSEGPPRLKRGEKAQPPKFLVESGQMLHEALTTLVFEPHSDELSVPPERAARALRSLVMGTWHPGAVSEDHLTPAEITELCLHGVAAAPTAALVAHAPMTEDR